MGLFNRNKKRQSIYSNEAFDLIKKGTSYLDFNEYDKALEYFNKALEIEPYNAWALNQKAFVLSIKKRYSEAINLIDLALSKIGIEDEGRFPLLMTKSNALLELRRHDDALECFDEALKVAPATYDKVKEREEFLKRLERI